MILIAYASLYPLEGWRDPGTSPFAFLLQDWPRQLLRFDMAVNVLAYAPFGFLCVAALQPRLRGGAAAAAATAAALVLSLSLEALQSYLPARFASNLDMACNVAGAALGAAAAPALLARLDGLRLRERLFLPGPDIDAGLVLLALWLFVQLNPATLLFGAGDLRPLIAPVAARAHAAEFFIRTEAFIAAFNLVAVGLLASLLVAPGQRLRAMFVAFVVAALAVKAIAFALMMQSEAFAWFTPGAQAGLAAGLAVALAAVALPRTVRLVLAAVLVMAATVFVNLAPPNPYLAATLKVWQQGTFLNFNGLTRLVGALWPFAALGYLIFLAARRR
ncbi:MAG TPA: VanZ family protein [Burkholderiales bacterium]|nr:VanZ family protein [Burkholderiales bacterium]